MKIAVLCPASDFPLKCVLGQNVMLEHCVRTPKAASTALLFFFENTKIILRKHFSWIIQETEHFIISVKRSQIGK